MGLRHTANMRDIVYPLQTRAILSSADPREGLIEQNIDPHRHGPFNLLPDGLPFRIITDPSDLLGVFRTRDVFYQCVKAELEIGRTMKLRVRINGLTIMCSETAMPHGTGVTAWFAGPYLFNTGCD